LGTTWFTSDLHLGHRNILKHSQRPFSSIETHDATLVVNWNDRVQDDDIVWVLGDLTIDGQIKHGLEILPELKGRKRLVSGNHDRCWVGKHDAVRWIPRYLEAGFEVVTPWARAKLGTCQVNLSHFPYVGDHTREDRYDQYRLRVSGTPLLHGHTHSRTRVTENLNGAIQLHVGVDAWDYSPVAGHVLQGLLEIKLREREMTS
jgi:calcineurin-like phosphoesterase family protein